MNYLSVEELSIRFGERVILNEVNFGVNQGEKIALVGINGSGKSTLFKAITGKIKADSGLVTFRNDIRVSFLEQNPDFTGTENILDFVLSGKDPIFEAIRNYDHMIAGLVEYTDDELANAMSQMDALQAWDLESQVQQMLGKLQIHDPHQKISTLSGGQKKRVALAQTLLEKPDLLILDEPTNHLDLDVIEWLEQYLSAQKMSLLLVTHDRYFLDKVTNAIVELSNGKTHIYKGNYTYFLEKKAEREEQEMAEVDKAKNLLRKELDWMRRQPKARGTKAKYRVDAFYDTKEKATSAKKDLKVELQASASRTGKTILEIENLYKSFGNKHLIKKFDYVFKRGDRIGVVGKNGSGKSTFLNLMTGKLTPDQGTVKKGQTIKYGYYTQDDLKFVEGQKVIDKVKEVAEFVQLTDKVQLSASQLLQKFGFPPKQQYDFVQNLSGGEKRRLQLLRVLIDNPNFLILDEPTNDLDLVTLNTLEDYLDDFPGCLVVVSHDRYFIDRMTDHLFILEGDGFIQTYNGNFTDYREEKKEKKKSENTPAEADKSQPEKAKSPERKISYKEKLEFEQLEKEMSALEKQKDSLVEKLNSGENDHGKLMEWGMELEKINSQMEEKEMRWLELSEWM